MTLTAEERAAIAAEQRRANLEQIARSAREMAPYFEQALAVSRGSGVVTYPLAQDESATTNALQLLTLDEFVQRPAISSHVSDIIPAQAFIVMFGPTKSGKTFAVCDMTMHAAHGIDWHGFRVRRPLRVAYMCGEGITGFKVRLHAWLQHHDTIEQPGEFRILPRALSLPAQVMSVIETLRGFAPDIVVTDTLNAYFGVGNESATQDMTAFVASVRLMISELGCSVVVVHHTGVGDQSRERGSIVLRGACDVVIQVGRDENGSGLVGFQVITGRDIEAMEEPLSLRLTRYETDWLDDDGQPMATCIVEAGNQPISLPGRGGRPLGAVQAQLLEIIREQAALKGKGEILLARADITSIAKARGIVRAANPVGVGPELTRQGVRRPSSLPCRSHHAN